MGCMYFSCCVFCIFFFFKQKTAYEMRISDWSSDVCSSDLGGSSYYAAPAPPPTPGRGMPQTKKLSPSWKKFFSRWAAPDVVNNFKIGRASCRERVCQYV